MTPLVDVVHVRHRTEQTRASHQYAVLAATRTSHRDATRIAETLRAGGAQVSLEWADSGNDGQSPRSTVRSGMLPPSDICFIALTHCSAEDASRTVQRARAARPGVLIVVVIDLVPEGIVALKAALFAGADDVALLGYDDLGRFGDRACQRAIVSRAAGTVLASLSPELTPAGAELFAAALQSGSGLPTATTLAVALGVSYRTLARRFMEAELPAPALVITWGRILMAAYIARVERCSSSMLAHLLEYSSPRGLRDVVQRHTLLTLAELQAPTVFDRLSRTVSTMLRETRSQRRTLPARRPEP